MLIKKTFLLIIFFSVCALALMYGASPQWFVRTFFGMTSLDINLAHIFRAIMGLYIGLGFFWLAAAFNDKLRDAAVLTVVVFGAGLLGGRIVSFIADGWPSPLLQFYAAVEVVSIPLSWWVYRRPD